MKQACKSWLIIVPVLLAALLVTAGLAGCGSGQEAETDTKEGTIEGYQRQAAETARKANLGVIDSAIQTYYASKGSYPTSVNQLVPEYIKSVPVDPLGGTYYIKMEGGEAKAAIK